MDQKRRYYGISEVAGLVGTSPSAIRRFEEHGLIRPGRTPGRHRLYTSADIDRLRRITYLRAVERLNLAAIRRELPLQAPGRMPSGDARARQMQDDLVGDKIRWWRRQRGWTIAELARRSGVSASLVSAVERGKTQMSYSSLERVARELGAYPDLVGQPTADISVMRLRDRQPHRISADVTSADVLSLDAPVEARLIQIAPGGEISHLTGTDEFLVVGRGVLDLVMEVQSVRLAAGDSAYIPRGRYLQCRNRAGVTAAEVLWVALAPADATGVRFLESMGEASWREPTTARQGV